MLLSSPIAVATAVASKPTRLIRIKWQIAGLEVKRGELRDQAYRIACDTAQADRERALDLVERQLARLRVEAASLMDDE